MHRKLLLISDLAGYGKVGMSAMFPILAKAGISTFNLPTALVSNTFCYGQYELLDTTEYLENTLSTWKRLNFSFDVIFIGFIASEKQANIVLTYAKEQKDKGVQIILDPIMGDDGELFSGLSHQTVENMQKLCRIADLILPNFTEALFLANMPPKHKLSTAEDELCLLQSLRSLGAKSIVVTSAKTVQGIKVLVFDSLINKSFAFPVNYLYIPIEFPGVGDIFSALIVCKLFSGSNLESAVKFAIENTEILIDKNRKSKDIMEGIAIEKSIELLNFMES